MDVRRSVKKGPDSGLIGIQRGLSEVYLQWRRRIALFYSSFQQAT
jgi:hypothetical protein